MTLASLPSAAMLWATRLVVGDLKKDVMAVLEKREQAERAFRAEIQKLAEASAQRERDFGRQVEQLRTHVADRYLRRDDGLRAIGEFKQELERLRKTLELREAA